MNDDKFQQMRHGPLQNITHTNSYWVNQLCIEHEEHVVRCVQQTLKEYRLRNEDYMRWGVGVCGWAGLGRSLERAACRLAEVISIYHI